MSIVLTIAGSDPSGGAGIQADLKTMAAHKVYGMSVITALTAQNTLGVQDVMPVPRDFFRTQLRSVLEDITPDAVKIGMMPNADLVMETAEILKEFDLKNIVTDTVMVSTSGHALTQDEAVKAMETYLFPLSTVITPNIPEAQVLWGKPITGEKDMASALIDLHQKYKVGVLVKGGHSVADAIDYLMVQNRIYRFPGKKVDNPNTHGTGCTLSSAIACQLAMGESLSTAVEKGKEYLTKALERQMDLGHGAGPLDHVGMCDPTPIFNLKFDLF